MNLQGFYGSVALKSNLKIFTHILQISWQSFGMNTLYLAMTFGLFPVAIMSSGRVKTCLTGR